MAEKGRILSIQSHVSSGFVGNRAAAFVLQVLGWDTDIVNTVQYSNHAGYGRFGGTKSTGAQLRDVLSGMEQNGLMRHSRLVTGFIPGSETLVPVVELATKLKAANPRLIYLLDPVMGDEGRLYVDADVVPIFRDQLLPLATIITPNWFEFELLTKTRLNTVHDLRRALHILHVEHKVPNVVISSLLMKIDNLPGKRDPLPEDDIFSGDSLMCLCSTYSASGVSRVHVITVDRIKGYFSGVGDLFAALVLAHYDPNQPTSKEETALSKASAIAVAKTHSVLYATQQYYLSLPEEDRPNTDTEKDKADPERRARRMRGRELRVVQSLDVIQARDLGYEAMTEWTDFWMTESTHGVRVASL